MLLPSAMNNKLSSCIHLQGSTQIQFEILKKLPYNLKTATQKWRDDEK